MKVLGAIEEFVSEFRPFENKSDMRTCAIGNLNIYQSVHWWCWDLFPDRDKLVTEKSESSLWSSCWQ